MNQYLEKILENTYTIFELNRRLRFLKNYFTHKFFQNGSEYQLTEEQKLWLNSLGEDFLNDFQQKNFTEIFKDIDKEVENLKALTIYLSFSPPPTELVGIGKWLRQNYGKNFLFETKFDPDIVGGCALIWNGVYKDYSLRAKIRANKETIISSFKKYIK